EAPLPKGWPAPGPYDEVSEKNYPKYRAAVTTGGGGMSFWTLFSHIKKKEIPMTAPVEMKMVNKGEKMEKVDMAFLYQSTDVGTIGSDGKKVEVKDVETSQVLSYTWMGADSKAKVNEAKGALDTELKRRGLVAQSFRMLGYNGPGTPRSKHTYELQAILAAE
ncbi:heme-binding protein, partial [Akkermansiaceae bacterium]|nr:heme-binding protein [Akkermansiaceae bacterium]